MNEKRTNPANPALNISEVYHVLFRHKWKILAIWVLGVIATGVIWFGIPTPYQSEAKLLVRYVEEHKSPGAAVNDSSIQTLGFGSGSAINNEILTLTSLDLAQQVADSVGPERILAKIGGGTNRLQAAAVVRSGLTPEILPGSTVIRVVFKHADRDVVQPVLAQLVDSYLKEHGKIHQGLGTLEDALRQQKDTLGSELRATERDLRAAKTNAGVISQEDAKHYNEQLFKIREELFRAEAELAEHQATLDAMTNTVPTTNSSLAVQPSNAPPDVVDEYKRICNQLETQEKYEQDLLAQRMKPENAFVQLARKRIEETVKRKRQLEQDHPQLTTTTINSQGRLVETPSISHIALMNETTRIRALHAKINTLNRQLDKVTQQTASAEEMEATIRDLESKRNLQQKSLESLSEGLDRALFDQQLSSGKASNITPLQSPTPPSKEYTKAFKILRAVLLISLVGGIAFAFIFELVLDRSFKRPFEVEMRLGLPLFLTIPQTNLNGNHRRLGAIMQNVRLLPWKSPDEKNGSPAPVPAEDPDPLPLKAVQRLQPFFEALRDRLIMFFEMKNMTHKPKLVAVTSCGRGAGVTTVASGLAASLSETGDGNVLLVDMNIEGGAAHFFHRGELTCDLDDALEMEKRNTALVQDHLYVVTEKSADDKLPRILHKRFSSLIPRLKTSDYDYIIFDMPAVSQISPTPRVARFMDMVMLVVESEKTERDAVKRASDLLAESKANVSVVLNKTRDYVPRVLQQHS